MCDLLTREDTHLSFNVNGLPIILEFGEEVDLLEPVYNALLDSELTEHRITTTVDKDGHARNMDVKKVTKKYEIITMGDWFWPKGSAHYVPEAVEHEGVQVDFT